MHRRDTAAACNGCSLAAGVRAGRRVEARGARGDRLPDAARQAGGAAQARAAARATSDRPPSCGVCLALASAQRPNARAALSTSRPRWVPVHTSARSSHLRRLFVEMDTDDSGTLDLGEFRRAMAMHPDVPPEQAGRRTPQRHRTRRGTRTPRLRRCAERASAVARRWRRYSARWTSRRRERSTTTSSAGPRCSRRHSIA